MNSHSDSSRVSFLKPGLLAQLREERGWTQAEVAKRAEMDPRQYFRYERGEIQQIRRVRMDQMGNLRNIARVFGVNPDDLLIPAAEPENTTAEDEDPEFPPNWYVTPEFDPIKMTRELSQILRSRGGQIDQTFLYLDNLSAACWLSIVQHESYLASYRAVPLERAAVSIAQALGGDAAVDVIALGCGDGQQEVRLAQGILHQRNCLDMRLHLFDISPPLLSVAHRHAVGTLEGLGVQVVGVQGDFRNLSRYITERSRRRRVVCMLGNTLGNLENELLFVRNSLGCLAPGDLLLVDAVQCFAPANQHEEIHQRDPWLSPQSKVAWQQRVTEFLSGPIRRYASQAEDIELRAKLGYGCCPVPGSYAVEIEATFRLGGVLRRFTLSRTKRQDSQQLVTCLQNLGWESVEGWHYGEEPPASHPELLHLFRRGTSPA